MTRLAGIGFASLLLAGAIRASAQSPDSMAEVAVLDRSIRIAVRAVPVAEALEAVASAGGVRLSYSPDLLGAARRVTMAHQSITVGDALREILAADGLAVTMVDGPLVIIGRVRARPRTTRVLVYDKATGTPIDGAILTGGSRAAVTDATGELRMQVPSPTTFAVRRIGYMPASITVDSATLVRVPLTPAPVPLDRIVVIGSETETVQRSLPTAVTVVRAEEVRRGGYSSLADVLRATVPGLVLWDDGPGSPALRVGSLRGSSSFSVNYMKTYVDGVEVAAPYLPLVVDPAMIERIEVIRGPQGSALYGTNASGGVLHVIMRRAAPGRPRFNVSIADGRMSSSFVEAAVPVRSYAGQAQMAGTHAGVSAAAQTERTGVFAPGSRATGTTVAAAARFSARQVSLDLMARHNDKDGGLALNPIVRRLAPNLRHAPGDSTQGVTNSTAAATLRLAPVRWATARLVAGRDRTRLRAGAEPFPWMSAGDSVLLAARGSSTRTSRRASVELTSPWESALSPSLTLGADRSRFEHDRLPLQAGSHESPRDVREASSGTFAQAAIAWHRTLYVTAGIRSENSSAFGPNYGSARLPLVGAAMARTIGPLTLKARAASGRGIRAPASGATKALPISAAFTQLANSNLAPEAQRGSEWGFDAYLSRYTRVQFTRYRQRAEDLIQQVLVDVRTTPKQVQQQNVGTIANDGWELEAAAGVAAFELSGTYSRVDSRVEKTSPRYTGILRAGDRTFEVPEWTSSVTATLSGRRGSISVGTAGVGHWVNYDWLAIYTTAFKKEAPRPALRDYVITYPGYTTWRAAATLRVLPAGEIFARADNLTNVQRGARDNIHVNTGRTISVGLRATY